MLFEAVSQGFAGIEGIDAVVPPTAFVLAESSELETSLNDLAPIEFASGSAVILDDVLAIVDEAASVPDRQSRCVGRDRRTHRQRWATRPEPGAQPSAGRCGRRGPSGSRGDQ